MKTENQEAFTVVGVCVRTNNARELGPNGAIPALWGRVMQQGLLDKIPARADSNIIVVNSDYASDQNGDYDYTLGARVLSTTAIPEGFVVKMIKPGRYAVLSSEKGAPATVVPALWRRIWKMTPQEMTGARAFRTDFEVYAPSSDPQNITMEVHIGLTP